MFKPPFIPPKLAFISADTEGFFSDNQANYNEELNSTNQLADSLFFNPNTFQSFGINIPTPHENKQNKEPSQSSHNRVNVQKEVDSLLFYEQLLRIIDSESSDTLPSPSWESFLTGLNPPPPSYILEQRLSQFESSLPVLQALSEPYVRPSAPVSASYFIKCLKTVVCGQQSQLFLYNPKKHIFYVSYYPNETKCRLPGLSSEATSSIIQAALDAGSRMVRLKYTCKYIYGLANKQDLDSATASKKTGNFPSSASPILVAFANNILRILYAIESHITDTIESSTDESPSIISCYNTIREPIKIINMTAILLGCENISKALVLKHLPSSWKLLNALFSRCLLVQDDLFNDDNDNSLNDPASETHKSALPTSGSVLYRLFRSMLHNCVAQWFNKLDCYVGLGFSPVGSKSFVLPATYFHDVDIFLEIEAFNSWKKSHPNGEKWSPANHTDIHLYSVNPAKVPDFMSLDLARTCADIANCLVLISSHSTNTTSTYQSSLSQNQKQSTSSLLEYLQQILGDNKPGLSWSTSFEELEKKENQLMEYIKKINTIFVPGSSHQGNQAQSTTPRRLERSVTFELNSGNEALTSLSSNSDNSTEPLEPEVSEDERIKSEVQKSVDQMLLKLSDGSGASQPNTPLDLGTNATVAQIPLHIINTFSVSSMLTIQSKLLHTLLFQHVYSDLAQNNNESFYKNSCSLIDHMKLLHGIMLLGSGEMIVELEDMLFGQDISTFSNVFPKLNSLGQDSLAISLEQQHLDASDPHQIANSFINEKELAKFGPFGSLNLCTNPFLFFDSKGLVNTKKHKSAYQWPPGTPHIHYALSPCVDKVIKRLGVSESVRKCDFMNVGVRSSLFASGSLSSISSNFWSATPTSEVKESFVATTNKLVTNIKRQGLEESESLGESTDSSTNKRKWMYPQYCLAKQSTTNNNGSVLHVSSHPKYALGATCFLRMTYSPPALVAVIVSRKLIRGCYEKAFTWLVQLLHVRRVTKDIYYSFTINNRVGNQDKGDTDTDVVKSQSYSTVSLCWQLVSILFSHFSDRAVNTFWIPWIQKLQHSINSPISPNNPKGEGSATLRNLIETHEQVMETIGKAMLLPASASKVTSVKDIGNTTMVRLLLELVLQTILDFCSYVSISSGVSNDFEKLRIEHIEYFQKSIKTVIFKIVKELNTLSTKSNAQNDYMTLQLLQTFKELESSLINLL